MEANSLLSLINTTSLVMIMSGVVVFIVLLRIRVPYGRYARDAKKIYGPLIPAKLAWFVQESPSLVWPAYFLFRSDAQFGIHTVLIALFFGHYAQRTCVYPFLIRGGSGTRLLPFVGAFLFCFINGFVQSAYLFFYHRPTTTPVTIVITLCGVLLFFLGMYINISSDSILRNLRRPSESGYKIPYGGLFAYVSGANFFGEIIQWIGFAIASLGSLPACAFAWFTFCNIGPRGFHHHQFYREKFSDYPRRRKAVIPFIW